MSFSEKVKLETVPRLPDARHCQIAEFAGIFSGCGSYSLGKRPYLLIRTENLTVAKKSYTLFRATFGVQPHIRLRRLSKNSLPKICFPILGRFLPSEGGDVGTSATEDDKNLAKAGSEGSVSEVFGQSPGGRTERLLAVTDREKVNTILKSLKILSDTVAHTGQANVAAENAHTAVSDRLIASECCKRAYLRGAFLVSGSVTNPEKNYHLEIVSHTAAHCQQLIDAASYFGIEAKLAERKKYYVFYIKDGSMISDFLNIIGAHKALMDFENVRILKDVRNTVNRRVNCETANISKTVHAASRHVEDIRYIEAHGGLSMLPEKLENMARLRLEYPDISLSELGEMFDEPITKSGVNHRLRKISEYADSLRGKV